MTRDFQENSFNFHGFLFHHGQESGYRTGVVKNYALLLEAFNNGFLSKKLAGRSSKLSWSDGITGKSS